MFPAEHVKQASFATRYTVILFCLVMQLLPWQHCYGGNNHKKQAILAAYLYNFAKFTHWSTLPENAPLHFQIIGSHPFGKSLTPITSKTIGQHPIRICLSANLIPDPYLHIIFISRSHAAILPSILESVANRPVLTVSDIPDFTAKGGMIGIIEKGNNIRFSINLDAAHRAGLKISSQMLRLADSVITSPSNR